MSSGRSVRGEQGACLPTVKPCISRQRGRCCVREVAGECLPTLKACTSYATRATPHILPAHHDFNEPGGAASTESALAIIWVLPTLAHTMKMRVFFVQVIQKMFGGE
jgi:hypothetical protein